MKTTSKPKLLMINGSDTQKFLDINAGNFVLNPKILQKYTEIVDIGERTTGFSVEELPQLLKPHVNENDEEINIIFNMHGCQVSNEEKYKVTTKGSLIPLNEELIQQGLENYKKYYIEMAGSGNCMSLEDYEKALRLDKYNVVATEVDEVLKEILKVTKNIPLKIFAISCFGANLQNYLYLLPKGSFQITLSDINCPTNAYDLTDKNHIQHLDHLFKDGFKLEALLEIYCMNQRINQTTPIIGIVDMKGGQHIIDLERYVVLHKNKMIKVSSFIETLITKNDTDLKDLVELIKDTTLNHLKYARDLYYKIVHFVTYKTLLNQELENLNTNDFEDDKTLDLAKARINFFKIDEIDFAELLNFYSSKKINTQNLTFEKNYNAMLESCVNAELKSDLFKNQEKMQEIKNRQTELMKIQNPSLEEQHELLDLDHILNEKKLFLFVGKIRESLSLGPHTLFSMTDQFATQNYEEIMPNFNLLLAIGSDIFIQNGEIDKLIMGDLDN